MYTKRLKTHSNLFCLIMCIFFFSHSAYAQGIVDDFNTEGIVGDSAELFSETIQIISRSGKIFILTNSNQLLSKGDFITMALRNNDGAIARAVVAKTYDGKAGIKVLKVYSLSRWGLLKRGLEVDILKGDDSSLFRPKKKANDIAESAVKIESEEDLFNETALLEENLGDFYKDTRHIKPDNLLSAGWAQFGFDSDVDGGNDRFVGNQWNFAYGYQFADNFWIEGLFGRTVFDGFPDDTLQTQVNNFTARLKYTFKAPLYSYFMPYIGFQTYSVVSPDAGTAKNNTQAAQEKADRETAVIEGLRKSNIVAGVTVFRRLVPGWFIKADLGTDILGIGFSIEF